MASSEYEKVATADADTYSDASGSDVAREQDQGRTLTSRRRLRTSEDIRRHDDETLNAEEEAERLLARDENDGLSAIFKRDGPSQTRRAWYNDRSVRRRGDAEKVEEEEVLHDVEAGARRDSAESNDHSSEDDLQKLGEVQKRQKGRLLRWTRFVCLHILILVAFILLLFGAFKASQIHSEVHSLARMMSNGTSLFAPTTIIISLDGFRADFLQRNLTPTLNAFVKDGVSPKYMLPSFPSLTFPNHYTLATGHYPESHGIVGNTFWDPVKQREFYYTDPARSWQSDWWNAEPFWLSAELQGVRSAIHMWPGSEADIGPPEPAFVDRFKQHEDLNFKVDRILGWLDLPGSDDEDFNINEPRPQLIAAYVPDVDTDGHNFGPNSTDIRATITRVDNMLADIFRGIDERNLTNIVNIIVVSDHGMATTDVTRLIQFEDIVDASLIEHTDGWPLYGLRPYDKSDAMLHRIYDGLVEKSKDDKYKHAFDVYLRDENMPERYHFSNNPRIAPLWIVPKTGWAIVQEHEFNVESGIKNNQIYNPRGLHGYDFENPLMRAIFVARGPAFPHPKGSQVAPFQNIEVYNILCDSLGIEPATNNGTVRLPFKTSGLHDEQKPAEIPADPVVVPSVIPAIIPVPIPTDMPPFELGDLPTPSMSQNVVWTTDSHGSLVSVLADVDGNPLQEFRPWTPSQSNDADQNLNNHKTWWGWFEDELDDFKSWAGGVFHQDKSDGEDGWEVEYTNKTRR